MQTNLIGMDGLLKVVDPNQLTPDLEGTLQYDHATWIDLRCVSTDKTFHDYCRINRITCNNHNHHLSNQSKCFSVTGRLSVAKL